jgi:predicted RNA binding protein YcfA (HicA-like mRNA interferase family)
MRLPRDLSGAELIKALAKLGYAATRQTGSHVRLTCTKPAEHHVTVPMHDPLRIGTLASVLNEVAQAHGLTKDALVFDLFK